MGVLFHLGVLCLVGYLIWYFWANIWIYVLIVALIMVAIFLFDQFGENTKLGRILLGKQVKNFEKNKMAAEQGNPNAQFELGISYYYGHGTKTNKEEARNWLYEAAKQGHKEATDFLKTKGRF